MKIIEVGSGTTAGPGKNAKAWQAAKAVEATFLSEMLKSAGFGKASQVASGGASEEQFSSFLIDEYAQLLVDRGGFGLAEEIYQQIRKET